jgi:hypothetical protein
MFHHVAVCIGQNPKRLEADRLFCARACCSHGRRGREVSRPAAAKLDVIGRRGAEVTAIATILHGMETSTRWSATNTIGRRQDATQRNESIDGAGRGLSPQRNTSEWTVSLPKEHEECHGELDHKADDSNPQLDVNSPHRNDPREGERRKSRLDRLDEDDFDHEVSRHGGSRRRPGRQRRPFENLAWGLTVTRTSFMVTSRTLTRRERLCDREVKSKVGPGVKGRPRVWSTERLVWGPAVTTTSLIGRDDEPRTP